MRVLSSLVAAACLVISLTANALPTLKPNHRVVRLATSEWRPYVQNDSSYYGFAYETVEAAFKAIGYTVKIEFMSLADADKLLRSGQIDGFFPAYYNASRHQLAYSEPFSGGPISLIKRRGKDIHFASQATHRSNKRLFQDLSHYRFGVVQYYSHLPEFDDNPSLTKRVVSNDKENLEQLLNGNVDLIMMDKYVATYYLKKHFAKKEVEFIEPTIAIKQLYLAVPKQRTRAQQILADFNRGLKEINQTGQLSQIIDKDAKRMDLEALS